MTTICGGSVASMIVFLSLWSLSKRKSDSTLNRYIVAEVRAAVPATLRSRMSDFIIALRNRSRSSEMWISQGLFLFAARGSMSRFSGGLARCLVFNHS